MSGLYPPYFIQDLEKRKRKIKYNLDTKYKAKEQNKIKMFPIY